MAGDRVICQTNQINYSTIRKAMIQGARSVDEIIDMAGVCNTCQGCQALIQNIIEVGR